MQEIPFPIQTKENALETWVRQVLALVPTAEVINQLEAEHRAAYLLKCTAYIARLRRETIDYLTGAKSAGIAAYSREMSSGSVKKLSVTEMKSKAESNEDYQRFEREKDGYEGDVKYYTTLIEIFTNAHLTLRQCAKGNT